MARRSAEGTAELGRALVDLADAADPPEPRDAEGPHRAVDWDQVAKAVDWDRVFQIQSEYLRVSLERAAQLTQRYLEVSQAVVTGGVVAQRQAKKAA